MKTLRYGVVLITIGIVVSGITAVARTPAIKQDLATTVDLKNKRIADLPDIPQKKMSPWKILDKAREGILSNLRIVSALANPNVEYIKINPGMRKEEIAEVFGSHLDWTEEEKQEFTRQAEDSEGYFYPDSYFISADAGPEIQNELTARFNEEVSTHYPTSTRNIISIDTAIKIASIIQREAGGAHDMRIISGIIWNRIFKGMNLQMDATLQYAKGSKESGWWPKVIPEDKFIKSPYNTYQNGGFPPTPISNPSIAAISAALNPQKTDCLFYLHDRLRRIHCSETYDEHLANIEKYY